MKIKDYILSRYLPASLGGVLLPSGNAYSAICSAHSGTTIVMVNSSHAEIQQIDIPTHTQHAPIAIGGIPNYAIFSKNDLKCWVSNWGTDKINEVVLTTGAVTEIASVVGPNHLCSTPDEKYLFVACWTGNNVLRIRVSDYDTLSIPGFTSPAALACSHNGKYVYVTDYDANSLSRIDVETGTVTLVSATGINPSCVVLTPDDSLAFVANITDNNITRVQLSDASTSTIAAAVGPSSECLLMSPDGTILYACSQISANISRIVVADSSVSALALGTGQNDGVFVRSINRLYIATEPPTAQSFIYLDNLASAA